MNAARTKTEQLSLGTVAASVLCQSIYEGLQHTAQVNARSYVLYGGVGAILCSLLLCLFLRRSRSNGFWYRCCAGISCAAAAAGAVGTAACTIKLLGEFFSGSSGWLLLFFLLAAGWQIKNRALDRTGRVLRWLAAAAGLLLLAGVWSQLEWEQLAFRLEVPERISWLIRIRPEYLALPFVLDRPQHRNAALLPMLDAAIRSGFVFLTELVFGAALAQQLRYGELLRSWSLGIFSRYDSFLLLVWLMLALFRVAVLVWIVRSTAKVVVRRKPS